MRLLDCLLIYGVGFSVSMGGGERKEARRSRVL